MEKISGRMVRRMASRIEMLLSVNRGGNGFAVLIDQDGHFGARLFIMGAQYVIHTSFWFSISKLPTSPSAGSYQSISNLRRQG